MLGYIVDFYCHELLLVIEIDGESHTYKEAIAKDIIRQKRLEAQGVHFLRFDDLDVKKNMAYVLDTILRWIERHPPNPPQGLVILVSSFIKKISQKYKFSNIRYLAYSSNYQKKNSLPCEGGARGGRINSA